MPSPDLDKRKGKPRFPRRLPVRFGTEAKMCGGNVSDISEGGMRIDCTETFPPHSVITIFVQFPRHAVRLRARVVWCGAGGEGGAVRMGLALTQPEPTLKRAHAEWVAEVKQIASEEPAAGPAPAAAASTADTVAAPQPKAAAAPAPAPKAPEPRGPIRRRLESRQGQSYDALLERQPQGWNLTIVQLPRQLGTGAPDFESECPDYDSAEKALRDFVRTH